MSRLNVLSIAAATALVLGLPSFVAIPSAQQGASQFRAGVDLVAVDLLAVDDQGRPIADLRPANLQLKIDGRPRDIRQLEFIKVARTSVENSGTLPSLPAPFATNASDLMGRLVVLVVDEEHIRPGEGKPVLDAAARFLDRLAPTDRVALVTLPTDTVRVDATTDRERVRQSLARLVGKAPRRSSQWNIGLAEAMAVEYEQTDTDHPNTALLQNRECRFASSSDTGCNTAVVSEALRMAREEARSTRDSLRALTDLLNGLSRIEEPKTLVLMSGSLVVNKDFQDQLGSLVQAASLARAQLYVVQTQQALMDITGRDTPTSVLDDDRARGAGLADLASYAGGLLFQVSGTGDDAFRRIGDEISAFYLLGFKPESSERDGKRHKIELTSLRPKVTLRARPMFVIGASASKPAEPLEPRALVRDLSARRDLTLRAAAYAFRAPDRASMKVIVVVETLDPATTLNAAAFALIDPAGRVVREWTEEGMGVVVRPIVTATEAPPGEYKLRVGAVDTQGRRGAADYEFRATLTDASPMQLNVPAFGGAEQGTFRPALLVDRGAEDVTAYMEIYGTPPAGAGLAVLFEVAATPDGPALASARATILATRDADRRVATTAIPIRSLAAGDYAGRAVVTLNGQIIGRVWRTVRKTD